MSEAKQGESPTIKLGSVEGSLDELLRYVLAGLVGVFAVAYLRHAAQLSMPAILDAIPLWPLPAAVTLGALIHAVHRAVLHPLIYRCLGEPHLTQLAPVPHHGKKCSLTRFATADALKESSSEIDAAPARQDSVACTCKPERWGWPLGFSEREERKLIERWAATGSVDKAVKRWSTHVHFLYCSAWALFLSPLLAGLSDVEGRPLCLLIAGLPPTLLYIGRQFETLRGVTLGSCVLAFTAALAAFLAVGGISRDLWSPRDPSAAVAASEAVLVAGAVLLQLAYVSDWRICWMQGVAAQDRAVAAAVA